MPLIMSESDPDYREEDYPLFTCTGCGHEKRLSTSPPDGTYCVDCWAGVVGRAKQRFGMERRRREQSGA